jgi:hypothetical protein
MDKAYKLSFVAGGLLLPETAAIASRFLVQPDWEMIRKEVVTGKLLRTTRESSRARYFLEIRRWRAPELPPREFRDLLPLLPVSW